jgi:two-component system sensor histidine kinase KdpD
MAEQRPDPDQLLVRLNAEEAKARRGKLKIFFGASAGVGKTYAMLGDARQQCLLGVDVVIGVVETHGRAETEAMAEGLERLPLHDIIHRDRRLQEFDLDGALTRKPAIILMDELAHSNVAGSRHPKRWQDVDELLAAGIDVYSTVNVQHMETLNDIVSGITGVRVWETVPDRIFDEADEVVVVDLPPDELIERLRQGKVYMPQQAEQASKNFFRKGNLLALRELALRRTADRVDGEMQAYRGHSSIEAVWPNRGSLLACIGSNEQGEKIVRSCARLAAQLGVSWHAIHVEPLNLAGRNERQRQNVLRILKLAQDLGATTATLSAPDCASTLVRYAREHNLSRLVMGRPSRRWSWPWQRTLGEAIEAAADDLEILRIALPGNAAERPAAAETTLIQPPTQWTGYAAALALGMLTCVLATPLLDVLELTNIVMLFLLSVVAVALLYGRGPAVFAAFVGVALFDFFFVPPRFSFAVSDVQYLVTFAVMLVVALVVGQLTAGLKVQAASAMERERRVRGLYEMSRDLSAALMVEQVAEIGARFLNLEFGVKSAVLVADEQNQLHTLPGATTEVDKGVAQWAFDRGEAAGRGTDTLPSSKCLVLPLKATMRLRGIMAIELTGNGLLPSEQRRLLDTCASLMAISIERIHYIDVAQRTTLQMESERLRNSLLSAISHDLRTPLASLIGLADTVQLTKPAPTDQQQELILAMRNSALRMNALVANLLDMARLESGTVQLNRQWQPLEEVVGSALAASAAILAGRPLRVKLAPDLPLLHLDAVLIERVLVNLLENASKYTPALSPIELDARTEDDHVVVTLTDHGPGLPPGREEAIFEKFERGRKEGATPGVGLGLAICRAIMHAHGGTIYGESGRGEGEHAGARFILTLPRGEPPRDDGGMLEAAATSLDTESRS